MTDAQAFRFITWSYAILILCVLSVLAVAVFAAQPSKSRAALGGVWLLGGPSALLLLTVFFFLETRHGPKFTPIWFHGLSLFRWYDRPAMAMKPELGEAVGSALSGVLLGGIFGGLVFAYVAMSNPRGAETVAFGLGSGVRFMWRAIRSPRYGFSVLKTGSAVLAVSVGVAFFFYTAVPWSAVGRFLETQFWPPWVRTPGAIQWRKEQREVLVNLSGVWQRISLPDCTQRYWVLWESPQAWAEIQTSSPGRERSGRYAPSAQPFFRKPRWPEWIRGEGWVRIKAECSSK